MRYMSEEPRGPAYPLWVRAQTEIAMRGWTWSRLAREASVARSTINNLRTQPRPPQSSTVISVAAVLGIPPAEALTLAGILPGLDAEESRIAWGIQRAAENWVEGQSSDETGA